MARVPIFFGLLLTLTAATCPEGNVVGSENRSTELPLPRDPDIAVRQELDIARREGTLAAFDLFIARHPEHRLAETARRERAELARRRPR